MPLHSLPSRLCNALVHQGVISDQWVLQKHLKKNKTQKAFSRQLRAASNSEKGANAGMSFFTLHFIHVLFTSLAHERARDKQQSWIKNNIADSDILGGVPEVHHEITMGSPIKWGDPC